MLRDARGDRPLKAIALQVGIATQRVHQLENGEGGRPSLKLALDLRREYSIPLESWFEAPSNKLEKAQSTILADERKVSSR
jgi:transcriptional regulator with XRE-family HTH domain